MNEINLRIMGLYMKIENNKKLSKQCKALAVACLFFSVCYLFGSMKIENITKAEMIITNLVWIVSIVALIGIYIKDSKVIKANRECEFDIYRLEIEDVNTKKKIAKIRGEVLEENIINKHIREPEEKVKLPVTYYGILLGIDVIFRVVGWM